MPAKSHRSDYLILGTLVTLTILIVLGFIWAGWLQDDALQKRFIRSARSTREDGVKGFYTLLANQGFAVSTHEGRLQRESLEGVGVLVCLDPIVPINADEVAELRHCLQKGLVLITTYAPHGLIDSLELLPDRPAHKREPFKQQQQAKDFEQTSVPLEDRPLPLARDIHKVCMHTKSVIKPKDNQGMPKAVDSLFRDTVGLRIAEYPIHTGSLVLLSDSSFLANESLGQADNAVLAVNLIAHALHNASAPTLLFDEYHFAYDGQHRGMGILSTLLVTTPAGWAVLCLALAGILLLLYKGRQFGPRRDLVTETRRSKMDYIEAVGATYCAAQAQDLTLRIIYQNVKQKLACHVGLPVTTANNVLAAALARETSMDTAKSEMTLNECETLLANPGVTSAQLQKALQQLSSIEIEVIHEHNRRK